MCKFANDEIRSVSVLPAQACFSPFKNHHQSRLQRRAIGQLFFAQMLYCQAGRLGKMNVSFPANAVIIPRGIHVRPIVPLSTC